MTSVTEGTTPRNASTVSSDAQVLRLFLSQRRQELLAPLRSIIELTAMLAREDKIRGCPDAIGAIEIIRRNAREMVALARHALDPLTANCEGASKALNHDLRTPISVILGYSDELRESVGELFLEAYLPEFEQIGKLGRNALKLVDDMVTRLRMADGNGLIDDVQRYMDRIVIRTNDNGAVAASKKPGRILVAEDHESSRLMIEKYLKTMGHTVVTTCDGREAQSRLRNQAFDLVLTDIEMPGANGFELIASMQASEKLRSLPVIALSGHSELDDIARCIALGADDYLPKPFNREILHARVEACLEKKRLRDLTEQERRRHKELLHSIMPRSIVEELSRSDAVRPIQRDGVAVLFADIVGFTPYCDRHQDRPDIVLEHLRRLFEIWEHSAIGLRVQKIKTIGDAFMAAAGLLEDADNPVLDCVRLGLDMIRRTRDLVDDSGQPLGFDLRVGVHVGPVVAGVLGRRQALFDLWGDTVNTAARLESHGEIGSVNLSGTAWSFVEELVCGETRSVCSLKGKANPLDVIHMHVDSVQVRLL